MRLRVALSDIAAPLSLPTFRRWGIPRVVLTISKYLLRQGGSDLAERARFAWLVSSLVRLGNVAAVREDLLEIAQAVLDGEAILEAQVRVAEVCKDADKGNAR